MLIPLIEETLSNNQNFVLAVNGTSMKPFLKNGDYVYLTKPNQLKRNDIILYRRNEDEYVLHRIVKTVSDYYVLEGDHQTIKEYPIFSNQVIAKVCKVKKNNKVYSLNKLKYRIYLFMIRFKLFRKVMCRFSNEN